MTDETKQDIENIATLALSTDEVQRRRAMCSLLGRVVVRQGDGETDLRKECDRWRAEAEKRGAPGVLQEYRDRWHAAEQERDEWRDRAESRLQALGQTESERNQYLSERNHLRADVSRLERERDAHKANAETLARDLAEARARAEKAEPPHGWKPMREVPHDELRDIARRAYNVYESEDAGIIDSVSAMLRWLEREGYLSVRLPPEK